MSRFLGLDNLVSVKGCSHLFSGMALRSFEQKKDIMTAQYLFSRNPRIFNAHFVPSFLFFTAVSHSQVPQHSGPLQAWDEVDLNLSHPLT